MILPSTLIPTLISRRRLFAVAFIALAALGFVALSMLSSKYLASASLVFGGSADPLRDSTGPVTPPLVYLTTQVDILKSERIASAALSHLAPPFVAQMKEMHARSGAVQSFDQWATEFVQRRTRVVYSRDSNLVEVAFQAQDPELAAAAANAIVDSFVDTALDLRGQTAEQYEKAYGRQTEVARKRLMAAQAALQEYQRTNKTMISEGRLNTESARLAELANKTATLRAALEEARIKERQGRARGDRPPSAADDKVWAALVTQEQQVVAEIGEVSRRLGKAHPYYLDLMAKRNSIRAELRQHRERLTSDLTAQRAVAEQQLEVGQKLEAEQRAKLVELGNLAAGAASLERDVHAAQQSYDQLLSAMQESGIQAQSRVGEVNVLERASVPQTPSSPNRLLFSVAVLMISAAAAAALALVREWFDPRVRSVAHLTRLSTGPLPIAIPHFGSSPRKLSVRRQRSLLGYQKT